MKRIFPLLGLLSLFICSAHAQTKTTVSKTELVEKTTSQKFYDRLKISYFAAFQGSSLGHWDDLALDEKGMKDPSYANNVFNQISFNYNFGSKMNFVFNPRWTINTGKTTGHTKETNGVVVLEDALVGFQGVLWTTQDKKFTFWNRTGGRLPTSRSSRKNDITIQPETMSIFTYDFNTKWQLGNYLQIRQWVYEQRYTAHRYRVYVAPYIQYALTDTDKVAVWYENYSENRGLSRSQNGKGHNFQEYWQNAMVSYSKDFSPNLNFMPFVGYFLNTTYAANRPLDAAWVGFWFSYTFKNANL